MPKKKIVKRNLDDPNKTLEDYLPKNHLGRPRKYDPDKMIPIVIEEMSEGASICEAARAIGIVEDTMYRWIKEYPIFSEALKIGKALSKAWWASQGRKNLCNDKFQTALYYINMKNRFDWHDQKPRYPSRKIKNYQGSIADKVKAADEALKGGVISCDEHQALVNSLQSEAIIKEKTEYEKRLVALEEKMEHDKG